MEEEETNDCATSSNVEGKIDKWIDLMSTFIQNNLSTCKLSTMFYFKFSSFIFLYTLS